MKKSFSWSVSISDEVAILAIPVERKKKRLWIKNTLYQSLHRKNDREVVVTVVVVAVAVALVVAVAVVALN